MKNILWSIIVGTYMVLWPSDQLFSNNIINQHKSKIKDILCQDWPIWKIETEKKSWLNNVCSFEAYNNDFYKSEKNNLDTIKISIETIDWREIYATADEILQSMYMMIWSKWMKNQKYNHKKNMKIPLSDWHKFVLCKINPWSETILRIKAFIKSKSVNVDMSPYLSKDDLDSLKNIENLLLYHGNDIIRSTLYITKDWNIRYFWNPHWDLNNIHYSVWATQSPYKSIDVMKKETKIPESLWETDFFTNYMNAKNQTKEIIIDPVTGYKYYNPNDSTYVTNITQVDIEWDKHRNIRRFLIQPHFTSDYWKIPKEKWRINAFNDIYKYYLFFESKNQVDEDITRENAFLKAKTIMENYIDPILNSEFEKRMHKNYSTIINNVNQNNNIDDKYFISPYNLYDKENRTYFVQEILEYNSKIFLWETEWVPFTKKEIEEILIDYNINFRKKDIKDAKEISIMSIDSSIKVYQEIIKEIENRPIVEYKIIQKWNYPDWFWLWDPVEKNIRIEKNPDKVEIIQQSFTKEEKERQIKYWSSFKFLE